ncbi:unnamed protein product [Sphagnum jensenii]
MACTANSLSTSDSIKVAKLLVNNLQFQQPNNPTELLPQSLATKDKPSPNSNLMRETFGNFRIFKNYANTVKSTFQLDNDKLAVETPMVLNICYQAPIVQGHTQKQEKRPYALSQSERGSKMLLVKHE